jgi:hypothetical protein
MRHGSTKLAWRPGMLIASVLALVLQLAGATPSSSQTASASPPGASCPGDNGGITLPKGFCATIFADGIGHAKGGFWPLHCVTAGDMEKRQITRQELVAAALKLGARPGTIRQWFHRAIPYRWQIRLMEYFEGPVEISDWAPEATAAIAKPSIAETWRKKHPVSS